MAPRKVTADSTITEADLIEIRLSLANIQKDLDAIKNELAETRGAYRLAKFIIALLGISGLGGVTAWLMGQGK